MDTPNYAESTVTGTSWKRVSRININNSRNLIPSLTMVEDKVVNVGNSEVSTPVANLSCLFDQNDPDDLELYRLLNKKYVKLREIRDNAPIVADEQPEPFGGL